ncbi:MAG: serine/threonine-protein kinase, partial [Ardenticatenaceae bacterium]
VRVDTFSGELDQTRFLREARLVARLRHPNVVALHDAGIDGARPFLVMELLAGPTLRERLRRGPLPVGEALRVTYRMGDALASAHRAGVLHLDVKPENIIFEEDGEPKLSDFGISRSLADDITRTQHSVIRGTAAYLAPEQLSGQPLDARVDVYALGVVLYEMLTGQKPFTGETAIAQAAQRLIAEPPAPHLLDPTIPQKLSEIVSIALARDPAERFSSVEAFAGALRSYEDAAGRATTTLPRDFREGEFVISPAITQMPEPPTVPALTIATGERKARQPQARTTATRTSPRLPWQRSTFVQRPSCFFILFFLLLGILLGTFLTAFMLNLLNGRESSAPPAGENAQGVVTTIATATIV